MYLFFFKKILFFSYIFLLLLTKVNKGYLISAINQVIIACRFASFYGEYSMQR